MNLGSLRRGAGRAAATTAIAAAALGLSGCGLLLPGGGSGLDEALQELEQLETPNGTVEEDVFDIAVGDCFPGDTGTGEIVTVETVACSEPHASEAYAAEDMADGSYPGEPEIQTFADDFCRTEFESFIGISFDQSTLQLTYLHPTQESWTMGDREILCIVYDPSGDLTGSLQGAAY